jgi:hypothetical protein
MSTKTDSTSDDLMGTADAAKIAGVNAKTIVRWFDAQLIGGEAIKTGTRLLRRVSRKSLEAYLASAKTE